jgi:hypothetical protein
MDRNIYFKAYKPETIHLRRYKQLETSGEKQYGIIKMGDNVGYATKTDKGWIITIDNFEEVYYTKNLREVESLLQKKLLKAFE